MNKFLIIPLTIIFHLGFNFILPWWNIIIASMTAVFICRTNKKISFFFPAIAMALFWAIWIYILDQKTGFYSSERIAALFDQAAPIAYIVPCIGAALIAGLSGLLASILNPYPESNKLEALPSDMPIKEYEDHLPDSKNTNII